MDMSTMSSMMHSTSTMSMSPSSTMSGMASSGSTASSMSMSSDSMMGMDTMAMTFFTSFTTPLFSMSWMPTTTGQYAGTCIFLIAFAAIFRGLIALRIYYYPLIALIDNHRRGGLGRISFDEAKLKQRRWRAREAVLLGFLDVILAAVGYLLMIAVMTMNVGYFMSVLGGVFVGSMVFGRFIANSAAH